MNLCTSRRGMRRAVVGWTILVSVAAILAAASPAAAESGTLRVWLLRSFVTEANQTWERLIREFARARGVTAEIEFISFADMGVKHAAAIESGNPPDVAEVDSSFPPRFYRTGHLVELTDVYRRVASQAGELLPNARPTVEFEGRIYGLPTWEAGLRLFVRKDLVEAAGMGVPATWDEVVEASKRIQQRNPGVYGFGVALNRSFDGDWYQFVNLWSFGGAVTDATGRRPRLNSPEAVRAFSFIKKMYSEDRVFPPDALSWTDPSNNEAFLAGKIAMTVNSASLYYALEAGNHPLFGKTVMAPMPSGPAGRFTVFNPFSFVIFRQSRNQALARELVAFLMHPEQFTQYMYVSRGQAAPLWERYLSDPYWRRDPNYLINVESQKYAQTLGYPGPLTPAAVEIWSQHVLTDAVGRMLAGGLDPAAALREAQRRAEEIFEAYGG